MSLPSFDFDYDQLPAERRGEVREAAARIKGHLVRTLEGIAAVGQELMVAHDVLGDGAFGRWIEAEFGMGRTTARRFMQVSRRFGGDLAIMMDNSTPSMVHNARKSRVLQLASGRSYSLRLHRALSVADSTGAGWGKHARRTRRTRDLH